MNIKQLFENRMKYPITLKLVRKIGLMKGTKASHNSMSSKWSNFLINIVCPLCEVQTCILMYNEDLMKALANNDSSTLQYTLEDIYDALQEFSEEQQQLILSYVKINNEVVLNQMTQYVKDNNKDAFIDLVSKNNCDLSNINKIVAFFQAYHNYKR